MEDNKKDEKNSESYRLEQPNPPKKKKSKLNIKRCVGCDRKFQVELERHFMCTGCKETIKFH